MSKKAKSWIIIVIFLILVGCGSVMTMLKWDFSKLETNKYEISDNFENINVITNTADIEIIPSLSSDSFVVCNEQKNVNHSVKVENNTVLIEVNDRRKWYEHIGINFNTPKITIYLPLNEYGKLMIKSDTGDIKIPKDFKFKSIEILDDTGDIANYASVSEYIKIKTSTGDIYTENISGDIVELSTSTGKIDVIDVNCSSDIKVNVSTGKINVTDTKCGNLLSKGDTGNVYLKNVIIREKMSIQRSTGNVNFKDCDANDIFVKTDTGNVTGNLLTDKVFFVETDTGRVDVPKIMADEKCEIITDTGNIKIAIN